MTVRVRIGPSPTGEPHVGTAYIALFNLAFARKHGGKFILRVEDTDQDRSRPEWEEQIMEGLKWLGLQWDEGPDVGGEYGPYRQSERTEIHKEYAYKLVEAGKAYKCFATTEELDALRAEQMANKARLGYDGRHRDLTAEQIVAFEAEGRPFVIRMKVPLEGTTTVQDRLRGAVTFNNEEVEDQILLKSDGYATYHLANVVDDHLMGITHVIRAEEWITSTPKHVILYQSFGWDCPEFIHMPLLRNKNKSKIAKRKNPVSIMDYKQRGFLPEAVLNYLAMLGFTMPDEREVFTFDEFVEALDWDRMHLGGPVFDLEKFTWLNGKYYREKLSEEELVQTIRNEMLSEERIRAIVPLIKERIDKGEDFIPATEYFFSGDVEIDPEAIKPKKKTLKELSEVLEDFVDQLDRQVDYSAEALEAFCRAYAEKIDWKVRDFFMPLRIIVTGRKATPPLFDTMSVLGRALVRRRIRAAQQATKTAAAEEAKRLQREAAAAKKAEKAAKKAEERAKREAEQNQG